MKRHYCTHCAGKFYEKDMVLVFYKMLKRHAWHCRQCFLVCGQSNLAIIDKQERTFVELFSGSGAIAAAAAAEGYKTTTIDIESKFNPDICIDIENIRNNDLPKNPDVLWASIPCTVFSVLNIPNHFTKTSIGYRQYSYTPATPAARKAVRLLNKTIRIIKSMEPTYFFIENPRGALRHLEQMKFVPFRSSVSYSDYGFSYYKPTDIFHNCRRFQPKPLRNMQDSIYTDLVTDLNSAYERSLVPPALVTEMLQAVRFAGG